MLSATSLITLLRNPIRICCIATNSLQQVGQLSTSIPEKPKRPKNAYVIFVSDQWNKVKQSGEPAVLPTLTKIISSSWKNMSEDDKEKYRSQATSDRDRYEREMITYKEMLKDDDVRKVVEQQGQSVLRKKIVSSVKVQRKKLGLPLKNSYSPLAAYVRDNFSQRPSSVSPKEWLKELSSQYKNLDDESKAHYFKLASEVREKIKMKFDHVTETHGELPSLKSEFKKFEAKNNKSKK